jgi:hypothetical protein
MQRVLDRQLVQTELRLQARKSCSVGSWKPIQTKSPFSRTQEALSPS